MLIKLIYIFIFILLSAINDYKNSKVSNRLVVVTIVVGIFFNVYLNKWGGLFFSLKGLFIPFIILYLFFIMNFLPAGDIKLFMAIGSVLGIKYTIHIMILSVIFGGIYSLFLLGKDMEFNNSKKLFIYFKSCIINLELFEYDTKGSIRFPFAPIVFISYLVFVIYEYYDILI